MTDDAELTPQQIEQICQADERTGRGSKLAFRVLLILCTTGWGFSLGMLVWRPPVLAVNSVPPITSERIPIADVDASDADADAPQLAPVRQTPLTIRDLNLIDILLEHGNVAQAISAYSRLKLEPGTLLYDQLMYRICVARELVGQVEVAGESYRALTGESVSASIRLAAQLGQARIWMETGEREMARAVLARAKSSPIIIARPEGALAGEVSHLLAQSFMPAPRDFDEVAYLDDGMYSASRRWSAAQLLALAEDVEPLAAAPKVAGDPENEIEILYSYGPHPDETRIFASLHKPQLILELVAKLAEKTAIKIEWSQGARLEVQNRLQKFDKRDVSVAIALDELLSTYNLLWTWEEDRVVVRSPSECDAHKLESIRREFAGRLLRRAVSEHPDHSLAKYSFLALGALSFVNGDYANATSVYDKFETQFPDSSDVIVAYFNNAKTLLKQGQRDLAIQSFFQVADGGHGHPLQSAANAYVGRLFLENGQIEEATRPLIRAVSTATGAQRAVPAIMLSSAYILAENSHAAVKVLVEERSHILDAEVDESLRSIAELITSYAGFLVAHGDLEVADGGRKLVQSLSHLQLDPRVGQHVLLIAGNAFEAVGLLARMEDLFVEKIEQGLMPWVREEVLLRLERSFLESGQIGRARALIERSLVNEDEPLSVNATLQLARLCMAEGNQIEALAVCRELLTNDLTSEQKAEVLRVMGRFYELNNEHYQAALCFAGMLPGAEAQLPAAMDDQASGGVSP
jgi:tetratricopeptide (TPR) repeat protein